MRAACRDAGDGGRHEAKDVDGGAGDAQRGHHDADQLGAAQEHIALRDTLVDRGGQVAHRQRERALVLGVGVGLAAVAHEQPRQIDQDADHGGRGVGRAAAQPVLERADDEPLELRQTERGAEVRVVRDARGVERPVAVGARKQAVTQRQHARQRRVVGVGNGSGVAGRTRQQRRQQVQRALQQVRLCAVCRAQQRRHLGDQQVPQLRGAGKVLLDGAKVEAAVAQAAEIDGHRQHHKGVLHVHVGRQRGQRRLDDVKGAAQHLLPRRVAQLRVVQQRSQHVHQPQVLAAARRLDVQQRRQRGVARVSHNGRQRAQLVVEAAVDRQRVVVTGAAHARRDVRGNDWQH